MSAHYLADMPRNQRVAGATTPPTSIGHTITDIALKHLLEARWQFLQAVNVQTDTAASSNGYLADRQHEEHRQYGKPNEEPSGDKHHQSSHQFPQRDDMLACWHVSNSHLEHTLPHLAQHVLEPQTIDLNDLIGCIAADIVKPFRAKRPNTIQHNMTQHNTTQHNLAQQSRHPVNTNGCSGTGNGSIGNGSIGSSIGVDVLAVDVGIATTLPTVSAPPLLLHWVFSELLITSWLNSLPANLSTSEPHNILQVPLTDVATVVVNCLDTDDAWHITISSDHHRAGLVMAALTQLQVALQQLGGDVDVACDDDALLQTVILPKVPCRG